MKYYILDPEVAGGFGENTVMDPISRPPRVTKFHYKFDGWLGDELLETVACFIVTQRIQNKIEKAGFTGFYFDQVEITKSQQFEDIYPNRNIPDFVWLKVIGRAGIDDFGMSKDYRIVVSARVLKIMDLKHCGISKFADLK